MRKLSPFCEKCGSKNKSSLTVDHVIPVSDDATLAYEPLNLRVYCQSCNASRSTNVTDNERAAVYAAIQARKQRQARYYASEVGKPLSVAYRRQYAHSPSDGVAGDPEAFRPSPRTASEPRNNCHSSSQKCPDIGGRALYQLPPYGGRSTEVI